MSQSIKGNVRISVKFYEDMEEFAVQYFLNGEYNEARTYYTDDRTDARETATAMRKEAAEHGYDVR